MTRMLHGIHLNILLTPWVLVFIVSILNEEVFPRGRSSLGLPTRHGK